MSVSNWPLTDSMPILYRTRSIILFKCFMYILLHIKHVYVCLYISIHGVFMDDLICSLLYGSIFHLLYSVVDNVPYYISSGLTIVHYVIKA